MSENKISLPKTKQLTRIPRINYYQYGSKDSKKEIVNQTEENVIRAIQ